jgi:hypothetical protein
VKKNFVSSCAFISYQAHFFSYPYTKISYLAKVFFIPSKTISYPKIFFHTFKFFFIPLNFYFHTSKTCFIPLYKYFIPCEIFFCFKLCFHFIPSTSITYPDHGISYQVAKFSYPKQPISYSFHFPLISLPDSLYIHLQLKQLVMFEDASYDQIMLLSLHPVPRDGCDRHRLHPHARHRTHFHRVVKHDHV